MTTRNLLTALAALLLTGVFLAPVYADDVAVPQPEFKGLNDEQKTELTNQLREIGVIGEDDKLEYSGGDVKPEAIDPATIATILAFLGPKICTYFVDTETAKRKSSCDKRKTDDAKAACNLRVDGWSKPLGELCNLVKLQ